MKNKIFAYSAILMLIAIGTISAIPQETKATTLVPGDVAVLDISCVSRPITYDHDEQFKAWLSYTGDSSITVEVKWYLDGSYVAHCYVTVPAGGNHWTSKVTIHWPGDFKYHAVTAKAIISDSNSHNNERTEYFRASLITS